MSRTQIVTISLHGLEIIIADILLYRLEATRVLA